MPASGHHLRLGARTLARGRAQAPLREAAGAVAADRDRPRTLHPLLPLRALLAGDLRGLAADLHRARRAHVRRHARRAPVRSAVQRQHHRALPGGRAHQPALPIPRAPLGYRGRGRDLHAVPVPVQRRVHRPRRQGGPSDGARPPERRLRRRPRRQSGGRRRVAVRQGPLRLPGDPRRPADHEAARARRREPARGDLGARVRGRGGARPPARADRRAGRRRRDQRGGVPARAAPARRPGLAGYRLGLPVRCARPRPRAVRPGTPGHGPRPRVRPHGGGARMRAARRVADPRPADPQGRSPQRRQARGRDGAAECARRECHARRPVPARIRGRVRGRARGGPRRRRVVRARQAAARRRRGRRDSVGRAHRPRRGCLPAAARRLAQGLGPRGRRAAVRPRLAPTGVARARRAPSPTPARATRRSAMPAAARRRRSPARSPADRCTPCICSRPIRFAIARTVRCGTRRCTGQAS